MPALWVMRSSSKNVFQGWNFRWLWWSEPKASGSFRPRGSVMCLSFVYSVFCFLSEVARICRFSLGHCVFVHYLF